MIISHTHKFIFVKTRRTVGSAVEAFFASYCSGPDVVSFVSPSDEMMRRQHGVFPMNNLRPIYNIPDETGMDFQSEEELRSFREQHLYHPNAENYQAKRLYYKTHDSAANIRMKLGTLKWDNYYKFCFEMSPWERTLGAFFHAPENRNLENASDELVRHFVETNDSHGHLRCNSALYMNQIGNVIVDDVFDHAKLDEAMQSLCQRFGFDFDQYKSFPKLREHSRKNHRPYEQYLSNETIGLIGELHQRAVTHMGYQPRLSKV